MLVSNLIPDIFITLLLVVNSGHLRPLADTVKGDIGLWLARQVPFLKKMPRKKSVCVLG